MLNKGQEETIHTENQGETLGLKNQVSATGRSVDRGLQRSANWKQAPEKKLGARQGLRLPGRHRPLKDGQHGGARASPGLTATITSFPNLGANKGKGKPFQQKVLEAIDVKNVINWTSLR